MKVRYQHTQTLPDGRVIQHDYEHSGPFCIDCDCRCYTEAERQS